MPATYVDLNLIQGDDFGYLIQLSNPDGTGLNIAGYTFSSWAKSSYYSNTLAATMLMVSSDPANGNLTMSLDAANTANLPAGTYVYDVSMKDTASLTQHILTGLLLVAPGVTNITPPANGAPAL